MKMSTAVVARLIGYTSMIDRNVWCSGNTVLIHTMRTPHTPKSVRPHLQWRCKEIYIAGMK